MMIGIMIRPLSIVDKQTALNVINSAARWYQEFFPTESYHEPEMTAEQWDAISQRMLWYGAFLDATLAAVMALEYRHDAALLRHAYVLPEYQRSGIGSSLREYLERQIQGVQRIIVGTYARNYQARGSLEEAGYRLSRNPGTILQTYYTLPANRLYTSVTYEKAL